MPNVIDARHKFGKGLIPIKPKKANHEPLLAQILIVIQLLKTLAEVISED